MIRPVARVATAGLLACAVHANVTALTLTFDEPGIDHLETVTSQYASAGVHFSGTLAVVKVPGDLTNFQNPGDADGQFLHFNQNPVGVVIDLDFTANYFSVEHRRPRNSELITISLFDGVNSVATFANISSGNLFATVEYLGGSGVFNRIRFEGSNKYIIDNLTVNPVPIPASALLLLATLPIVARRRKACGPLAREAANGGETGTCVTGGVAA